MTVFTLIYLCLNLLLQLLNQSISSRSSTYCISESCIKILLFVHMTPFSSAFLNDLHLRYSLALFHFSIFPPLPSTCLLSVVRSFPFFPGPLRLFVRVVRETCMQRLLISASSWGDGGRRCDRLDWPLIPASSSVPTCRAIKYVIFNISYIFFLQKENCKAMLFFLISYLYLGNLQK